MSLEKRVIEQLTENPYISFSSNEATDRLLDNYDVIKKEFLEAAKKRSISQTQDGRLLQHNLLESKNTSPKANNSMYTGKFQSITLYMTKSLLDEPEKKEANWRESETERFADNLLEVMPFCKQYILDFKNVISSFFFNVSYPGSRLVHHLGLDPTCIRLHYCIMESPGCTFDIENWSHVWKEREIFGFDDGNVFHGTNHKKIGAFKPRVILIIDIKKDYIKPFANNWPCRTVTPTRAEILEQVKLKGWDD